MGRPPAAVLVDQAEDRGVDRHCEPTTRSGQDAALRIDDLTAWRGEVDEPERLPLCRKREMRPAYDLERPEAECQQPEEAERDEPDHPDAEEEAGASMEVRRSDRNRAHAETPRDADTAPAAPRLRDEVAQRARSRANSCTSRPRRRTT